MCALMGVGVRWRGLNQHREAGGQPGSWCSGLSSNEAKGKQVFGDKGRGAVVFPGLVCGLFACTAQRLLLWLEFPSRQTNLGAQVL